MKYYHVEVKLCLRKLTRKLLLCRKYTDNEGFIAKINIYTNLLSQEECVFVICMVTVKFSNNLNSFGDSNAALLNFSCLFTRKVSPSQTTSFLLCYYSDMNIRR